MDILERMVKKGRINEEGEFIVEEYKPVGEIIDSSKDIWSMHGNYILSHVGVRKLAQWVRADWTEIEIVDRPSRDNDKGYGIKAKCAFSDGTESISTGSANDKSTMDRKNPRPNISNDYKLEMAEKRAMDRSFLRSRYIGLADVYSESESESFQPPVVVKNEFPHMNELLKLVALPEEDLKYPKVLVKDVLWVHKDEEYMSELCDSPNMAIQYVASGFLGVWERAKEEKMKKKAAEEIAARKEEKERAEAEAQVMEEIEKSLKTTDNENDQSE